MSDDTFTLDVVFNQRYTIEVDDVSDGKGTEFRCSIYNEFNDLEAEGWANNTHQAIVQAMTDSKIGKQWSMK